MSELSLNEKLLSVHQSILKGKTALETEDVQKLSSEFNELFKSKDNLNKLIGNKEEAELFYSILEAIPNSQITNSILADLDVEPVFNYCSSMLEDGDKNPTKEKIVHELLNLFRYSIWLQKISSEIGWYLLIQKLIAYSNYNFEVLFDQRVRDYAEKTLFKVIQGTRINEYSWKKVDEIVKKYSSSFKSLISAYRTEEMQVAFLLENSIEMATLDLACLTSGIRNVMIPANSVQAHISFILNQTKVPIVIAFDEKQLAKIKSIHSEVPYLKKVVLVKGKSIENWVISFEEFLDLPSKPDNKKMFAQNNINELTTIMYTSGTTGDPKGIMFSQMNIVYKRFCRALALPKISDTDRYLSFLPLFHTFGRYLELTGAVFWGGE